MEFKTKKELNSGMCSNAYVLDEEYIQLIGKREDSYSIYKEMKENSDLLIGKITCIDFPCNMSLIEPNKEYTFGSLIYKMVKGNPLNPNVLNSEELEKLAKKIVEFNEQLHTCNIHWDREWAIKHELEKIDRNIDLLKEYLLESEIEKLNIYRETFSNYLNNKKQFCITHGDLWADNLIVDENNQLTGIIDFGNMAYFLPEVDYASMWDMKEGFVDLLLKYSKENITKNSVLLFVMHRELCFFEYVDNRNLKEINKQLKKIKELATLVL